MPKTADLPLAAQIVKSARELYEKHDAFAIALAQMGVVSPGTDRPYTDSQVSKWVKGQIEPPFDVILASARLAQYSIDQHLFPGEEAGSPTDKKDRERLDRLEREQKEFRESMLAELASLREDLRDLGRKRSGSLTAQLDEGQPPP